MDEPVTSSCNEVTCLFVTCPVGQNLSAVAQLSMLRIMVAFRCMVRADALLCELVR
eukprot:jgi/Botrbrau1/19678/Bobra.0003s0040.1